MFKNSVIPFLLVGMVFSTVFIFTSNESVQYQNIFARVFDTFGLKNIPYNNTATVVESLTSTSTPPSTPTLADVIQKIQDHEQFLANQLAELHSQMEIMNLKSIFTRDLKYGDFGDDVSALQDLLVKDGILYSSEDASSSPVTGHFGALTKTALIKFQQQVGLKQTGIVDQNTRKKLYELAVTFSTNEDTSTNFNSTDSSSISEIQDLSSIHNQFSELFSDVLKNQTDIIDLQSQVSQLSSDVSDIENIKDIPSSSDSSSASIPTPTTSPSLSISNVQVSNITKNSATITWITSVPSGSEVDYSKNSGMLANQTTPLSSTTLVTSHQIVLANLSANTKYYYYVASKDSINNKVTSTNQSFSTTP